MTDIRTRLTDALADGLENKQNAKLSIPFARGRVAYHLADVLLALPGIAIVELPEPIGDRSNVTGAIKKPRWTCTINPDSSIEFEGSPEEARALAATLLAAANAAEVTP